MRVSASPHLKTPRTTKKIMADVLIALLPAVAAGTVYFGLPALVLCLIGIVSAVLSEFVWYVIQFKVWKNGKTVLKDFLSRFDYTSCITGLLLSMSLPAAYSNWYMLLLGSVFSVCIVKMLFGGTGKNIVNPAIAGRIFLFVSFAAVTLYPAPNFGAIASSKVLQSGATQLTLLLKGEPTFSLLDLFLGTGVTGCIGETCKLALLLGYGYMVLRGVIKWYLPLLMILAEGLTAAAIGGFALFLPSILSGGLIFSAVFMATDYVTTPKTFLGNLVYFTALGILTAIMRAATGIEVASFCILLMNFTVFLLDRVFRARPFGYRRPIKTKKEAATA